MPVANWDLVKTEYITGNLSYRKLAEKHDISFDTLKTRAVKGKWSKERGDFRQQLTTGIQRTTTEITTNAVIDHTTELLGILEGLIQDAKITYIGMVKTLNGARTYVEIIEKITKTVLLLTGKPTEINKNLNENTLNIEMTKNEINVMQGVLEKEKERFINAEIG